MRHSTGPRFSFPCYLFLIEKDSHFKTLHQCSFLRNRLRKALLIYDVSLNWIGGFSVGQNHLTSNTYKLHCLLFTLMLLTPSYFVKIVSTGPHPLIYLKMFDFWLWELLIYLTIIKIDIYAFSMSDVIILSRKGRKSVHVLFTYYLLRINVNAFCSSWSFMLSLSRLIRIA